MLWACKAFVGLVLPSVTTHLVSTLDIIKVYVSYVVCHLIHAKMPSVFASTCHLSVWVLR